MHAPVHKPCAFCKVDMGIILYRDVTNNSLNMENLLVARLIKKYSLLIEIDFALPHYFYM